MYTIVLFSRHIVYTPIQLKYPIDRSTTQDPSNISWINCYGFLSDKNKKKIFSVWRFLVWIWLITAEEVGKTSILPIRPYSISCRFFVCFISFKSVFGRYFLFRWLLLFHPTPHLNENGETKKKKNKTKYEFIQQ